MKYESTKRVVSKVAPDVTFVLKRMNVFRRDDLEEQKAPFLAKISAIREALDPLTKAYREAIDAATAMVQPKRDALMADGVSKADADKQAPLGKIDFPDDQFKRWLDLTNQVNKIDRAEMTPLMIRYVLVRIEGLEIDGEAGTFDSLLQAGTDELYDELAREVARELGILPAEAEDLKQPCISPAAEGGAKSDGNADHVETPEMTTQKAA